MNVVAIRCEACDGTGKVMWETTFTGLRTKTAPGICPVCCGSKVETPPQDHDKDARRAIKGASDDA